MSKKSVNDDLEKRQTFSTGSERQALDDVRYDLISPIGLKRLAQTYAEGARRYTDRNWEKGQPFGVLLNHARDHINDFIAQQLGLGGDLGISDEDHLAHAVWNLFAVMHFQSTKPHMNDLLPPLVEAAEIAADSIEEASFVDHPAKHAFHGDPKLLCQACKRPRRDEIHYIDDREEKFHGRT